MTFLTAIVVGLVFGAADTYLGSRSAFGLWAVSVSQISAPWLVLPFIVGMTQHHPRRAAMLGLVVTMSALVGFFAMTYSPMEGVPLDRFSGVLAMMASGHNPAWILGGMVSGPLFGLLGQRWRVHRSWVSASLVVGALCLEPLARWMTGQLAYIAAPVWRTEVALGAVLAGLFASTLLARRRASATPN